MTTMYEPQTAHAPVALARNELPAPPAPGPIALARAALGRMHRYPDMDASLLRERLAIHYGVGPEWIVAAAGSVSVIQQAMLVSGLGRLILPWPSFDAFPPLALAHGLEPVYVALSPETGACDLAAVRAVLDASTTMVIICTPNSPTGGALTHREIAEFLRVVPSHTTVVIDQAYAEFSTHTDPPRPAELVAAHPRTMVTGTFSKAYGLAGLRVGYAIASPEFATTLRAAGVPYAVTAAAEAAAIEALHRTFQLADTVAAIRAERRRLTAALNGIGVNALDGHGNFVWVPHPEPTRTVAELFHAGVQVKAYPGHGIRVTVGSRAETEMLAAAWAELPHTTTDSAGARAGQPHTPAFPAPGRR